MTSSGLFLTSDVLNRLQVTSRQEKKNVTNALLRLHKEGLIVRAGNRDGCLRRVDNEAEPIGFLNVKEETLDIRFPFEIEKYIQVMPKNILVIAGEPNAGKTAFLLNFVRMNMEKYEIHYFSSEMGSLELRARLSKFDYPLDKWNFHPWERSSNYPDVIRPDAINIIDFLEVYEDFYKIGGMLKEIYGKLNKGIAFVAIQKNVGCDFGLGGQRGMEIPRLYLAMERHKIKILKGKNWARDENPNGLELAFKLISGCKFQIQEDWHKPN